MHYEVPVMSLTESILSYYVSEEDWAWIQEHPECIPDILDDAANSLRIFLEDTAVETAITNAVAYAKNM